jgi:hypothetical protein
MRKRIGAFDLGGAAWALFRMALASLVGAAAAWGIAQLIVPGAQNFGVALLRVTVGGIAGLVIAFALGSLLRVSEVSIGITAFKRLFGRLRRGA